MSKETFWAFFLFIISVSLVIMLSFAAKETNRLRAKQAEIKPCKCLTISEALFHIEKREMFVDKLQHCKMSQRSAIIDSINFHNAILDSTGNKIEY